MGLSVVLKKYYYTIVFILKYIIYCVVYALGIILLWYLRELTILVINFTGLFFLHILFRIIRFLILTKKKK